jgi:GNAT superfamily N-acetyltransferase
MPIIRRAARAYALLRTRGLREAFSPILEKLFTPIYERKVYLVLEKDLERLPAEPAMRSNEALEVREGRPAEVLDLLSDEDRARAYLSRGYRSALAFSGGGFVAWCWWTDGRAPRTRSNDAQLGFFQIELAQDDAWGFGYEVLPSYRGRGRSTRVLDEVERLLVGMGYRRLLGYVDAADVPARWMYVIRDYRPIRTVTATLLFSRIGLSNGRLIVRTNEKKRLSTFPCRPVDTRVGVRRR